MKLYLDEDSSASVLLKLLRQASHDVQSTVEAGQRGQSDVLQMTLAIQTNRVVLTKNFSHFKHLHTLILTAEGHHPGIVAVYSENNPRRDMTPRGIAHAISKLAASGIDLANQFHTLNEWR